MGINNYNYNSTVGKWILVGVSNHVISSVPVLLFCSGPEKSQWKALRSITRKILSLFGYINIVAVFHLLALIALAAAAGVLRTSARRRFSCPSSPYSCDDCQRKYEEQIHSGLPFYGFVLSCFASLSTV